MENPFQLDFMHRLKALLPEHISLADELMEVLQVSQDSAYRRIRGDTAMSIDEAIQLCNHYKIPITYFTQEIPGLVNFRYLNSSQRREDFYKHLELLYASTDGMMDHDNRRILYGAIDIPLFHHFGFESLSIFKMHFWMQVIMGISDFKEYYDENDVDHDLIKLAKKIADDYLMIPSDEVWPEDILTTTLKQLEYYWDAGYFKSADDALRIIDQLMELTRHIEAMATISKKMKPRDKTKQEYAEFNLYHSDVLIGNNTVITIADDKKTTFISHMTFNAMSTTSRIYTDQSEAWIRRLISKSTLISGSSEKNRTRFFRSLRKYIEASGEHIKNT